MAEGPCRWPQALEQDNGGAVPSDLTRAFNHSVVLDGAESIPKLECVLPRTCQSKQWLGGQVNTTTKRCAPESVFVWLRVGVCTCGLGKEMEG